MRIIDLHEDFGVTSLSENVFTETAQNSLKELSEHEDTLVFAVTFPFRKTLARNNPDSNLLQEKIEFTWIPDFSALFNQASFFSYLARTKLVKICKSKTEIDRPGTKFLLSIEGCDLIPDYTDAYLLYDLGIRSVGISWNQDNKYAASCFSKKDYGLTGSGRELIGLCNRLGMIVDMAHASPSSLVEAVQTSSDPVIVSHTNVLNLADHKRNVTDEGIAAVADSKGVVGISGIGDMINSSPKIDDLAKHINYIGENFGWEYVAIGSDFLGMLAKVDGFTHFSHIADLEALIEKPDLVFHKNAERVLNRVLKS